MSHPPFLIYPLSIDEDSGSLCTHMGTKKLTWLAVLCAQAPGMAPLGILKLESPWLLTKEDQLEYPSRPCRPSSQSYFVILHSETKGSTGLNSVLTTKDYPRFRLPLPLHLLDGPWTSPPLYPVCPEGALTWGFKSLQSDHLFSLGGYCTVLDRKQWTEALRGETCSGICWKG